MVSYRYPQVPMQPFVLPKYNSVKFKDGSVATFEPKVDGYRRLINAKGVCARIINDFAKETTIHGIWNVVRNDLHWFTRVVWAIAFAACFFGCTYVLGASVARYFSFEVKTTESLETEKEVSFPSITICNENLGRKSMLGNSHDFLRSLTAFVVNRPENYDEALAKIKAQCATTTVNKRIENFSRLLDSLDYESWNRLGMTYMMSMITPDSIYSVAKCWWKEDELNDCGRSYFMNHQTDYGWCFTFNPHPNVVDSYVLGFELNSSAYGLSDDYKMLKLTSAGPNNAFRVILFVNQEDYCYSRHDAVGFKMIVHDPRTQPLFFFDRPIHAAPGFETHVGVRLRRVTKETEYLRKCTRFQYLYMYPHAKTYFKEACYKQCFSEFVHKHCGCIPAFGPPRANHIVAKLNNLTYVSICWNDKMLCMKKYERKFLDIGWERACESCLNPCEQLSYDFQISQQYFPVKSRVEHYVTILANATRSTFVEDASRFRENYAVASFYVESMSVTVLTETQSFTVDQLVADIGGQIGFLLGMSVLSLLEFLQLFMPKRRTPRKSPRRIETIKTTAYKY